MEVIIVEDEDISAEKLVRQLHKIDQTIEVKAIIPSVKETRKWLADNTCDLIFLDIHLSDGLSFKIFEAGDFSIPVIFTTAYDEYAIKAFKLNSIDYLLKPIHIRDLTAAVEKYSTVATQPRGETDNVRQMLQQMVAEQNTQYKSAFLLNQGERILRVGVNDIAYFFADAKHVFAVDKQGAQHVVDVALDSLKEQLNPRDFFRVNRKLLVNSTAIGKMYTWPKSKIKLDLVPSFSDDVIIPAEKVKLFKQWLTRSSE